MALFDSIFGGAGSTVQPLFQQQLQQELAKQAGSFGVSVPAPATPAASKSLTDSPAFGEALLNLAASLASAGERGVNTGAGLAMGGLDFVQSLRKGEDRIRDAERQATQDNMAYLKDLASLNIQRETADLNKKQFDQSVKNDERNFALNQQQLDISRGNLGINQSQLEMQQQEAALKIAAMQGDIAAQQKLLQSRPDLASLSPDKRQAVIVEELKQQTKNDAELAQANTVKKSSAQSFINKVSSLENLIKYGTLNAPENADPNAKGNNNLFGPIQGGDYYRTGQAILGINNEAVRQEIDRMLADLQLDVAGMKLKGQGTITDAERALAKATLPTLQDQSAEVALNKLQALRQEANGILGSKSFNAQQFSIKRVQ